MTKEKSYWYALKCNDIYVPILYASKEYLNPKHICTTKNQCVNLCSKLNKKGV